MNKVSVQSLNECFNVSGENYIEMDNDEKIAWQHIPGPMKGKKHMDETKKLISLSMKGKPCNNKNYPRTDEWKNNLRNSMKNAVRSEEWKEKQKNRHVRKLRLISPEGKIVEETTTVVEFAKKYCLNYDGLRQLLCGIRKSHKGWTVLKVSTLY